MALKRLLTLCLLLTITPVSLVLGADSLRKSSNRTVVDGEVESAEYSFMESEKNMELHLNWTGDDLFIALEADTSGWVAVGVNSKRMNGAHILIGFVDGSNVVFTEHMGKGHGHRDTGETYVKEYEIKESGGVTTLEVRLAASDVIENGQRKLDMIFANGADDSLTMYHARTREGISVSLQN